MRSLMALILFLSFTSAQASDFYFSCQNESKKIDLDFNLIRGTWLSIQGLSPFWTHLMLMEVKPETLIFEVKEAGAGEADFLRAEIPASFLKGQKEGSIEITSLIHPEAVEVFNCRRDESQED